MEQLIQAVAQTGIFSGQIGLRLKVPLQRKDFL